MSNWIRATMAEVGARAKRSLIAVGSYVGITILVEGPLRAFHVFYRRRRAERRPIYVEDLPGARELEPNERQDNGPAIPAHPAPKANPFKARLMRRASYPKAEDRGLLYRDPPLSGLTLAGVGEEAPRRAPKFFHAGTNHIYGAMNQAFLMISDPGVVRSVQRVRFDNRRATGPIAPVRRDVPDPAATAAEIKERARAMGACQVGCTPVDESYIFDHATDWLPRAIVVAAPMEREELLLAPSVEANHGVIDGYYDVGKIANDLAMRIRHWGWHAEADTNLGLGPSKVMHVPLAVAAGLGTMGRHTSLITESHGANVRLATVLTDLPLAFDEPVDFGVERMCADCRVCRENCPSNAIYEEKQMVRGVRRWHVDFDRCMPYFTENQGCAVCITVCPWSDSGKGPLTALLQQHRGLVQESYPEPLPEAERLIHPRPAQPNTEVPTDTQPDDWWQDVMVAGRREHPGGIVEFHLRRPQGGELPDWSHGAHVEVMMPSGTVRAYSLSNPPTDRDLWRLGVKVEADGKGGSHEMGTLREGQALRVSRPGVNVIVPDDRSMTYLVAGGIGVTPMVPAAHHLRELGRDFEVHYAVRASELAVFADELHDLSDGRLHIHTEREWLKTAFAGRPDDAIVHTCGPRGFMDAVEARAVATGLPRDAVYREDFGSAAGDHPFELVLGSSGERIPVAPGETIARALGKRGVHIPISCGYGLCGTCTLGILDGEQDASDKVFTDAERRTKLTACCSRAAGTAITIDL